MTIPEILNTLEYGLAPEASKPAEEWLNAHNRKFGLFINNEWREPSPKEYFDSINPANKNKLADIAQASDEDVQDAVKAARKAYGKWSQLSGHARARYLYAIARQIQKHSRLFAVLETMDNGKPIRETRDIDIPLVARHFYHHAGWAQLMSTEMKGYESLGVVGQIIPWNFPLLMLSWKIAPALAMGNTVVLKPAEFTSLTALFFAEICAKILPPGVVNIITGDGRTGAALVNADVDKIAFTGSTDVGRIICKATAGTAKKLSLELGGKSPFIVFDDADLDSAVEGVVDAIWFNQGQVCCAGSRLLVQEGVAEKMYKKLKARMEKLRVGDPLDKAVDIGAIVAPVQLQRIEQLVQQGQDEGAVMWQPSWSCPTDGYFYPPTLFTNVAPASTIAQVEIFGPVLAAMTFRTPEEAVKLANNTRFGLAASIWSEDINLALDIATQIKAGTIWINSTNLFDGASGFGGYRESGFGREGGKEGLFEYVKRTKDEGRRIKDEKKTKAKKSSNGNGIHPSSFIIHPSIDRTAKLFINGKQARPDSGYSLEVKDSNGNLIAEVGAGNRKDIRNAVEAARGVAEKWFKTTGHSKAQILYYLGENLAARASEFAKRISEQTGVDAESAIHEVEASIEALFTAAAWSDKYDGVVHNTPIRNVTLAVPEAIGVMAILLPDDKPLLALCQLAGSAIAMGNALVVVPSPLYPLSATDFYQVLETSDVPDGVINIVTGNRDELAKTLSEHDDVDAIWYAGSKDGGKAVQVASAGNMKQTWVMNETGDLPEMEEILRHATQVKNIWVPYGA